MVWPMELRLEALSAIDMHVHLEVSAAGHDGLGSTLRAGANAYFRREMHLPSAEETAAYFRERSMAAVMFAVDAERTTGVEPVSNDEVLSAARANRDVLIPFVSVDPGRGTAAIVEAERLIGAGARGFKLHPALQAFTPSDRLAYPLYELIEASRLPIIFHTGHSGIGAGLRGGGGIRLKYGNPMDLDDVAADFPDLTIILAHPSFPWQDEALSVSLHKPNVYIDLSGWLPRHFPAQLVQYANTLLADKVMFGSDYPLISPDRWLADFENLPIRDEVRPRILKGTAARLLGLDGQNG
jgi:predicted TIM-barrel fold metal-dependent hydrolase